MQKSSSPELVECEHFEESNSKIHTGILLLAQAYHKGNLLEEVDAHLKLQGTFLKSSPF